MTALARFSLLVVVALLSACSSRAPAPIPQPVVQAPHSSFNGNADDVLFRALGLVGTPYRYGGNTPAGGFDCSGLIVYVYQNSSDIKLPRTIQQMSNVGTGIGQQPPAPGDLVFFGKPISHVAIYLGPDRMLHAPRSGSRVKIANMDMGRKPYIGARRL